MTFDASWLKHRDPIPGGTAPVPHGLKTQGPKVTAGCFVVEFGYGAGTRACCSVYPQILKQTLREPTGVNILRIDFV